MKKYFSLIVLFASAGTAAYAQQLNVNKGDQYTITTAMSTSIAMKRGDKQVDMSSVSAITKLYSVTEAAADGYRLSVTTKKVTDTLDAFGNQLTYSSERAADPNSQIEVALSKLVNDTYTLSIDKAGKITKVDDPAKATLHKEISSSSSIYHKDLEVGQFLNFGSSIQVPASAKKGTSWNTTEDSAKNSFTVAEINGQTTTVSFKSEASQTGINTNLNGMVVIDNVTGVVLQRVLKINSISNIQNGDKSYTAASILTVAEVCNKVN